MRSADALIAFEDHLRSLDLAVYDLEARSAINAMLTFYAGNRAEDVAPETDGDMLLFQWASLKRRPGPGFEYNITRQLITLPGDEEDIWQLSLTLYFSPDSQNSQLGSGDRWHEAADRIDEFASYIDAHPATAYAATHRPAQAELRWGSV
jgi:hypothetical protein